MGNRKRNNKWVERRKGIKCNNCDNYDWRFLPTKYNNDKRFLMFYCIHCHLITAKVCDEDLIKWRERGLKEYENNTG